jgi:hypothetical protein
VAVCLLHAYANPVHEQRVGQLLRAAYPDLFITLSHEILREFREYERTSTTVLNAYVGPPVQRYLHNLRGHLQTQGLRGNIQIMRSNGGSMSLARACIEPVSMMESGPVAGMIGAGYVARLLGLPQAIGFDMGKAKARDMNMYMVTEAYKNNLYENYKLECEEMFLPERKSTTATSGKRTILQTHNHRRTETLKNNFDYYKGFATRI